MFRNNFIILVNHPKEGETNLGVTKNDISDNITVEDVAPIYGYWG